MKIKYEFVTEETVEIEVSEEMYEELKELDIQEHRNNRKETRRHISYNCMKGESYWLASECDSPERMFDIRFEEMRFERALSCLTASQREIYNAIFCEGMSGKEYAEKNGISHPAVSQHIEAIRKKFKKLL